MLSRERGCSAKQPPQILRVQPNFPPHGARQRKKTTRVRFDRETARAQDDRYGYRINIVCIVTTVDHKEHGRRAVPRSNRGWQLIAGR